MSTRGDINVALGIIGKNGLEATFAVGKSASLALSNLLESNSPKAVSSSRLLTELKRRKLVDVSAQKNGYDFRLTPAGVYRLQESLIKDLTIPKPKKWDKKWRLVAFDVPIQQSRQRSRFTSQLKILGFQMVQKSLWTHPYPCFEQIERIAGYFNVLRFCTFMEVSRLDDLSTARLKRRFDSLLK